MIKQSNQTKFQQRVKERYFWFRLGTLLLGINVTLFILFLISSFLGLSFYLFNKLLNLSLYGVLLGSIFTLFFSRIGWSKFPLVDLLLNRISILLMIGGLTLEAVNIIFEGNLYFQDVLSGFGITIIGGILWLLGIRFQSSIEG